MIVPAEPLGCRIAAQYLLLLVMLTAATRQEPHAPGRGLVTVQDDPYWVIDVPM